jgi:Ca2+-binding RTX toxin-like protein
MNNINETGLSELQLLLLENETVSNNSYEENLSLDRVENSEENLIQALEPQQSINGDSGDDVLLGDDSDNTIIGYGGDDKLYGRKGNDLLHGGKGNDTVIGGSGNDTMYGGQGADFMKGGFGDDTIQGNRGYDLIVGQDGSDIINGNEGNDRIFGGNDNDFLFGDEGDDQINGMLGVDELTGGTGADIFVFSDATHSNGSGYDTITDFEQGTDLIDLSAFGYTSLADLEVHFALIGDWMTFVIESGDPSTFAVKLDGRYELEDSDFIFS